MTSLINCRMNSEGGILSVVTQLLQVFRNRQTRLSTAEAVPIPNSGACKAPKYQGLRSGRAINLGLEASLLPKSPISA